MLSSRRDDKAVLYARRGGPACRQGRATKKLNKISLPKGNLDFTQSLRYIDSVYMNKPSSISLELGTKSRFQFSKNIYL